MQPENIPNVETVDYRRKWHAMAAVGTGVFLATVDSSIINVSLPTLVRALNTEFAVVQWVVLAYLLTVTSTMASIGRLADMVGKKSIYMIGFIIFTFGSALCGLSPSVKWLIGFRVLQATGAAMIMALGAAIVTEAFPPIERGKAMGMIGSIVSIGIVMGPALGGVILSALSWRWIFYVNLTTGFISFVGLGGTVILLPFYLENILGFPSMQVGLLMGIVPVMLGVTSLFAGALSDRVGSRKITMTGLVVLCFLDFWPPAP
jgi:MFS family permease